MGNYLTKHTLGEAERRCKNEIGQVCHWAPWVTHIARSKPCWEMVFMHLWAAGSPCFLPAQSLDAHHWVSPSPGDLALCPSPPPHLFEAYDIDIDVFGKARAPKCVYRTRLRGVYAQQRCIGRDGGQPRKASAREGEGCLMQWLRLVSGPSSS